MKKLLGLALLLPALALAQGAIFFATNYSLPNAATPTFSPVAGSYSGTQAVTISTATTGCDSYIYWNTVGSPTTGSTHSTSASVTATETVYAKVIGCPSYSDSAVGSAAYTITAPSGIAFASGTGLNDVVQSESGAGTASHTFSVSDTNTTILFIAVNESSGYVSPPSISGGTLSWTNIVDSPLVGAGRGAAVWKATATGAVASETVTVHTGTYFYGTTAVVALKNVGSLGTPVPLANGSHGTANTISVTTTGTGSWVLGMAYAGTVSSPTYTADTTVIDSEFVTSNDWLGYKTGADAGTYTLGPTNVGGDGVGFAIEIKP